MTDTHKTKRASNKKSESESSEVSVVVDPALKKKMRQAAAQWVTYDNSIRLLKADINKIKAKKQECGDIIQKIMTENNYDVDIQIQDADCVNKVYMSKSTTLQAASEGVVRGALMEYFMDEGKANELYDKIQSKRTSQTRTYIKRTKTRVKNATPAAKK